MQISSIRCRLLAMALFSVLAASAGAQETGAVNATPHNATDLKSLETQIQKGIATAKPAVVAIGGGSGVVISADGYILTVAHVAQRAGRHIQVTFPDGKQTWAVTLGNDFGLDAGMLKIESPGPWPHADTLSSRDLKVGQWCISLGFPMTYEHGMAPVARIGRVLRSDKNEIITDSTIMGGDSGGPLVNLEGKVIGIGTKCDASLIYNIHVATEGFANVWQRLLKSEDFDSLNPPRPLLGVSADADGTNHIERVRPGGPADKAGLSSLGDTIIKVDGHDVRDFDHILSRVRDRAPGDTIDIVFTRDGKEQTVSVKLGETPMGVP